MLTMKKTNKDTFVDIVSGKTVGYYVDKYGTEWMAVVPYRIFNFRTKTIQSLKQPKKD
jgi:hypothetical protein